MRLAVPPQHGAWAFVIVPLAVGAAVAQTFSASAALFSVAWVAAFPVSYYLGRALTSVVQRRAITSFSRREAPRALPWLAVVAAAGIAAALRSPWLLLVVGAIVLLWGLSFVVAQSRGERSVTNSLLLVAEAVVAVPVTIALARDSGMPGAEAPLAQGWFEATAVTAIFLLGSVLHVKALIRKARDPRFRRASLVYHAGATLACAAQPVWLLAAIPALVRTAVLKPGRRPAVLGAVETVASLLLITTAALRW